MELKRVPIKSLKGAKYNPNERTRDKSMTSLIRSISEIGLIYPIAVDKHMNVIDGHRRIAALIELGEEDVAILVVKGEVTNDTIYGQINATAMKMTGHQNLQVFLKNPNAVTSNARNRFNRTVERFGIALLKQIASQGMSMNVVKTGQRVAHYLDIEDDKKIRDIIRWLILHRNSRGVHVYIESEQPARTLALAIKNNKPLRVVYRGA